MIASTCFYIQLSKLKYDDLNPLEIETIGTEY